MSTFIIGLTRTLLIEVEAPNVETAIKAMDYIEENDASWDKDRAELGFRVGEITILERDAFEVTNL